MPTDWERVLLAHLHDPPDKAQGIRGHEGRAAALARIALGRAVERTELHADTRTEDQLSSASERLPLPNPGPNYERAVGPEDGRLLVRHPLSGAEQQLDEARLDADAPAATLTALVQGLELPRPRFLALWRRWREDLAGREPTWALLPADTRQPDHTIWNHCDIVAGLQPALDGSHGIAFLSFNLGPVQTFIAAARSVRDLWTGSFLLSWLTFQAMRPLLREVGPAAFVFPALRGNPLLDLYLREPEQGLAKLLLEPDAQRRVMPCLPNRFVAVVPWGPDGADARGLAGQCAEACRAAWRELAARVHTLLAPHFGSLPHSEGWDCLWDKQLASCFEISTAVLPERACRDEAFDRLLDEGLRRRIAAVRSLAEAIPKADQPGYPQQSGGLWMGQLEVLGRLSAACRSVRHVPDYQPSGTVPPKCSLLGTYEQMGPATLKENREFWDAATKVSLGGSRVRDGERLCAVSLVKRFAWPAFLADQLALPREQQRFADTATVAARRWLNKEPALDPEEWWQKKTWSGQWLHWTRENQDAKEEPVPKRVWELIEEKRQKEKPPAYYAVLVMDGDHMGQWLRGDKGPPMRDVYHPKLRAYFEALPAAQQGLSAQRPVTPALHASISEALANFALHFVPRIVREHDGELIYAGGDDVLAFLPTVSALACARALREAFRQDWQKDRDGQERLLMGARATVSAGLAVVHYKEDLRFALATARQAEKAAKDAGRNALTLTVCRRSGEHSSALLPWDQAVRVEELVTIFTKNASDRWAYKLRAELPTLRGPDLPREAVRAEVKRLLDRLEEADRTKFQEPVLALFDAYHAARTVRQLSPTPAEVLEDFVTLCQSASFLARGRDE